MALLSCSAPVVPLPQPEMGRGFSRTTSARSAAASMRSSSVSPREVGEERPRLKIDQEEEEEKVYVALGKEVKEGRANLLWALQNAARGKKIVVVHVHRAATKIPIMGAHFAVNQLQEQEVMAYRRVEREKMSKLLKEYLEICASQKVRADKVVIEKNDIAQGLVEVIAQHGITNLVMGAAADKHYSRRMKAPRSKKALTVQQQADQSCKISFVCKGKLICTREVGEASVRAESSATSPSTRSSMSENFRSISLPQCSSESFNVEELLKQKPKSVNFTSNTEAAIVTLSNEHNVAEHWDEVSGHFICSNRQQSSVHEMLNNIASSSMHKDEEIGEGSIVLPSLPETEEDCEISSPHDEMEDMSMDIALYEKLKVAFMEAENLKREAYEESRRRQKAERDLVQASQKVKAADALYTIEVKQRKEIEERLARENARIERHKQQLNQILDELKKAQEQTSTYELQIRDSELIIKDLEGKISDAYLLLEKYQQDQKELLRERDDTVKEAENLRRNKEEQSSSSHDKVTFSEFSYSELKQATNDFDESLKIGEGGYGSVYKGFLRHTVVAIKVLNPDGIQGNLEFNQEVEILSKVRHPNLVTLIGACTEIGALVYEFFPNGSLEDRLTCKHQTQPLTWKERIRIAAEVCSALIFLHSSKPQCIVHGDLKPANILLDANCVSKLGDFGICRLLSQSNMMNTLVHRTYSPKGTFAYMDPEYLATGELTPQYDVYSYGITLLRLLTGKPAFRINKVVQEAMDKRCLHELLDASAGEWPFEQAKELANLGLRCCDIRRKSRSELRKEAWTVLESMRAAAITVGPSWSFRSDSDHSRCMPSYFLCPILQEIMADPHIAADGFTYEAQAIKEWIHSGHDTSPMTNLKLSTCELIPNHALRSAIKEWSQKREFM
ncbi:U-box domain-containing protein 33-like isoform X1 [Typha latifolia]|uniref:U-box domain-containing protein 33-like isoform X1 n=1 Tax=Typha latifolia TaxID=4733 RepID=UPI003C308711